MCNIHKTKTDRKNRKRGYEGEIDDPLLVEIIQRTRGTFQHNEQISSQVGVSEAPTKMQEEQLQLEFIPYMRSDRIPLFEASMGLSGLDNTGAGLNMGNIDYHQSVTDRHAIFVLKSAYLKDMEDTDPFNIS